VITNKAKISQTSSRHLLLCQKSRAWFRKKFVVTFTITKGLRDGGSPNAAFSIIAFSTGADKKTSEELTRWIEYGPMTTIV
jgi:hypothetical protein